MPRSSQYLLDGYTYHLTHRCHGTEFLLSRRADRQLYRQWLREGVARFKVPIYAYCVTRNHTHVVVHATSREAVSNLMHLASGAVAKRFNVRNERLGSMWQHPFQCTVIQDGQHLINCLRYVDLNMVRAGVVGHPRDWPWCSYDELTGRRQRFRILNLDHLLERLGMADHSEFHAWYRDGVERELTAGHRQREAHWTESLAVGDERFVGAVLANYRHRVQFQRDRTFDGAWFARECSGAYGTKNSP